MTDIVFGFKRVETNEHAFARFLRRNKAIDTWQATGKANTWFGPDGRAVAQCHYDNAAMTVTYWIRADLSL